MLFNVFIQIKVSDLVKAIKISNNLVICVFIIQVTEN